MSARTVAFGLGANLGDARAALRDTVDRLRSCDPLRIVRVSSLYRTTPVGGPPQPDYLNAVVVAKSAADPRVLLRIAQEIEQAHQRTRQVRWGPRTLDVDILAVEGVTSDDPRLTLPHPRAHLRGFVLVPWAEIDPDFEVPGRGTVAQLLAALDPSDLAGIDEVASGETWGVAVQERA
jgi:2-amino-4-hydroxy-6-hydroxymethyldihydropteridine diphosphokinase